jgi:hypothetical protein
MHLRTTSFFCLSLICYTFVVASAYLWFTEKLPMARRSKSFDRVIVGIHRSLVSVRSRFAPLAK